jgi:serine/threonine protein phosphatase PrpC
LFPFTRYSYLNYVPIGDVPRVNGQLAVARAFGDESLKAHLSSEPDFKHVPINSNVEFAILASDGLWKVCACFPLEYSFTSRHGVYKL